MRRKTLPLPALGFTIGEATVVAAITVRIDTSLSVSKLTTESQRCVDPGPVSTSRIKRNLLPSTA
jgi:hypothetical protein